MTNRCYLSSTDYGGIYPSHSCPNFNVHSQWVVHGAGCLPLIWLPMFTEKDLVSQEFTVNGETFTTTAPVVLRETGIQRLQSQRDFLNRIFENNGGLNHHIDMFTGYLQSVEGEFLTVELEEIEGLYETGQFQVLLRKCLVEMSAKNPDARETVLTLSTVIDGRRFITLQDAIDGKYEQQDMWNYFRIMGEPYLREVPWS